MTSKSTESPQVIQNKKNNAEAVRSEAKAEDENSEVIVELRSRDAINNKIKVKYVEMDSYD